MYTRYFHSHSRPAPAQVSRAYCPPVKTPGSGHDSGITPPDSGRIAMNAYTPKWVTTPVVVNCVTQKVTTQVNGNGVLPYVEVGTTPESVTTANRGLAAQQTPVTTTVDSRFAQYFPPAPRPYVCPERLPSNEPAAPDRPCVPITRFEGSRVGR
jgi:hypothetical protein